MKTCIENYIGKRFGILTVAGMDESATHKNSNHWIFRCDCGKEISVAPSRVLSGHHKSCGCKKGKSSLKHGCNGDEFYPTWYSMMQRCYNPNHHKYESYGARGISVCDEWKDPKAFIVWARDTIGTKKTGYTVDRYDNNADYCPENCHWATPTEQARNRRSNRMVTLNGITKPFKAWCDDFGISDAVVRERIKLGWSYEDAFTIPISRGKKYKNICSSAPAE